MLVGLCRTPQNTLRHTQLVSPCRVRTAAPCLGGSCAIPKLYTIYSIYNITVGTTRVPFGCGAGVQALHGDTGFYLRRPILGYAGRAINTSDFIETPKSQVETCPGPALILIPSLLRYRRYCIRYRQYCLFQYSCISLLY